MGKYRVTTDGGVYEVTTEDAAATPPPNASTSGNLSLGKTDISANPSWSDSLRKVFNFLPDVSEAVGGAAAAAPAVAAGGAPALLAAPAGMTLGRAGGEALRQEGMNLIRPSWMPPPPVTDQLTDIGKAGVSGATDAAVGLATEGIGHLLAVPQLPAHADSAAKLARALQPKGEERKFIQKLGGSLANGDIVSEARLTGRPIQDAASLESASGSAVRTLDEKIKAFIEPFSKNPQSFNIDGNKIADAVMANVPIDMATEKPAIAKNIAKQVAGYRRPIGFDEAKDLLAAKNRALHSYYQMSPADRARADVRRSFLVDTAVADTIRSEMYPKISALAGPGMEELMQRQGAAINVRDLAHNLADTQAMEPGLAPKIAAAAPTSPTKAGVIKSGARYLVGESPNQLIKRAFSPAEVATAQPSYPTPTKRPIAGLLPSGTKTTPPYGYSTPSTQGLSDMPQYPEPRAQRFLIPPPKP